MTYTLKGAWQRVTLLRVVEQVALSVILFLLAVLWLNLSDGTVLNLITTALLALVIVFVAGIGEAWIAARINGVRASRSLLLRGLAAFVVLAAVWLLLDLLIGKLSMNDSLRAGYLNSKAPRGMRNVLTYDHLERWMGWGWSLLQYVITGIVAAFLHGFVFARKTAAGAVAILRSAAFWLVAVVGSLVCLWLRDTIMLWVPGHSLGVETLSLVLRLTFVTFLLAGFVCYLIAVMAARTADSGTLDDSHPRTVDKP